MEDSSPSQNHNGQLGPSSGGISVGNKQSDEGSQRTQYSIPGILHFIQHEWARFEMERSQWEVDRAELQVINVTNVLFNTIRSVIPTVVLYMKGGTLIQNE
jgi:hypothetical protein